MTKKKNKKRKINFDKIKLDLDLNEETTREIIAFIIGIFVLLFIFSFLGQLGPVGLVIKTLLLLSFGITAYAIPAIMVIYALNTLNPEKFVLQTRQTISILITMFALPGLFALIIPGDNPAASGGYIGQGLAIAGEKIVGLNGSFIIIIALLLVSIMLFFNTPLLKLSAQIIDYLKLITGQKTVLKINPGDNDQIRINTFKKISHNEDEPSNSNSDTAQPADQDEKEPVITQHRLHKDKDQDLEKASDTTSSSHQELEVDWTLPPLSILEESNEEIKSGDIDRNVKIIENTLAEFSIDVEMKDVNIGPTVTQYTFKPPSGVKLAKITSLQNDLALALAAHPLRLEAPIPGKSLVGIEIPNIKSAPVRLKEILESPVFKEQKYSIPVPLGRNISGKPVVDDLTKMPHLLIAGATGSGKSVFINIMLMTLLCNFTPDQIKLILVDPKKVELSTYNKLPHLLTPVVTEAKNALNALKWGLQEMNDRYQLLSENKARNIASYNQKNPKKKLPYIVIVIDELADLMMTTGNEIETAICRLAQMARATGIHLVIATQRPSVDVITGLIKANIATRIAFAVASQIDSRTILDSAGAEKLLGKGDMLYISRETGKPTRIQGVYASDQEIESITQFWKNEGPPPEFLSNIQPSILATDATNSLNKNFADVDDDLFQEVLELVITTQQASASYLQRKLKIGYARAARLVDILEQKEIISTQEGNKPRKVLIKSLEELNQ